MYKQLTSEQRYAISALLQNGTPIKYIAETIKVSPSTVYREIRRNSGRHGRYNWQTANCNARYHRRRKNHRIPDEVVDMAVSLLRDSQWSPVQISARLKEQGIRISHETIYRIIRRDRRKGGTLYKNCRHRLKHRARPVGGGKHVTIPARRSISERPPEADGTRFGDFEMDTIIGRGGRGAIVTLIERSTNILFMRKLSHGKNARSLSMTVIEMLEPFKDYVKTITTDNGTEFACHAMITEALGAKVYFTDPYSSWQKGSIENMNGLIRQYIPKSASFSCLTDEDINYFMNKINMRPRKKLNFSTPFECFYKLIL